MSLSKDQSRAHARANTENDHHQPIAGSRLGHFARRFKGSRHLSVTTGVVVALLGIASLGQGAASSPKTADVTLVSSTSGKSANAPGKNKPTAAPAPTATATPTPTPTATATATAAPTTASPAPTAPATAPQPVGAAGNWTMAFSDEFNGSSLDTAKWSNCWFSPTCGTMNNVTTSPSNVSVANGALSLNLSSSTSGALVSTNPKGGATQGYQFTTGYVEARIKFSGSGSDLYNWPAWWTSGQSWPTNNEIDIAEGKGALTSNYMNSSGTWQTYQHTGQFANAWHVFGMQRNASTTDIYVDGVRVKTFSSEDPAANPHYLILNVGSGRGPAAYGAASTMSVDYVRAWK